jgi:hypothetical protein
MYVLPTYFITLCAGFQEMQNSFGYIAGLWYNEQMSACNAVRCKGESETAKGDMYGNE